MEAVKLEGVIKDYGWSRWRERVLHGIDLQIEKGEMLGLIGRNGAGKSTTLGIISTIIEPTQGKVTVCGHDASKEPIEVRRRIGLVPENVKFYPGMKGRDVLEYLGGFYDLEVDVLKQRVQELTEQFGLEQWIDKKVDVYSHGTTRKMALAQAMINVPELLILDEPFNGLDVHSQEDLKDRLAKLNDQGMTIILSTHNLAGVQGLCGSVAFIDKGKVLLKEKASELGSIADVQSVLVIEADVIPPGSKDALIGLPGVVDINDTRTGLELKGSWINGVPPEIYGKISSLGIRARSIYLREPELGEIFMKLTSNNSSTDSPKDNSKENDGKGDAPKEGKK